LIVFENFLKNFHKRGGKEKGEGRRGIWALHGAERGDKGRREEGEGRRGIWALHGVERGYGDGGRRGLGRLFI